MLLDLFELVLRGRAKRVVSGEEHPIRQQLYISSCIIALLRLVEITTEGQSLKVLVDHSFHPCKSICYSSSACMHAPIDVRKEGSDFGAFSNYLPAVGCTLLAPCQARDQETWPPWRCRYSQRAGVLRLWLRAALRSPSALYTDPDSREE